MLLVLIATVLWSLAGLFARLLAHLDVWTVLGWRALFGLANSPHPPPGLADLALLFVFGLTTIGLAFVLFMEGAKLIPSAEAGLISLLDVVFAPIWVFLAFGENRARRRPSAAQSCSPRRSGAWRRNCAGKEFCSDTREEPWTPNDLRW